MKRKEQYPVIRPRLADFGFFGMPPVALLGTHPDSDNQTWHIPTAPALTGKEFIKMAAEIFQTKSSYFQVNKTMLNILGIFNKLISETSELYYQYEYDYIFDSTKFENYFQVEPTPYAEGIRSLSQTLFARK